MYSSHYNQKAKGEAIKKNPVIPTLYSLKPGVSFLTIASLRAKSWGLMPDAEPDFRLKVSMR
jgi:hypothetical protein